MRTTQNIEQIFSKISNFWIDIKYWLINKNFDHLPDIEYIYNEKYVPTNIFNKIFPLNVYFESKKSKLDYTESVNKLLNFNLVEKNIITSEINTNLLKMLSFLEYYIFEEETFIWNEEIKKRNELLLKKAIDQIGIEKEKIIVHMLDINDKYVPFTNVFALCCYVLICLDKQGYKLNYWNINSENKEIWEQIYNKITKNKFVFKVYSSQEEINQKFYKKYLLSDDQNYGVNYGVFANIASEAFNRRNISTKSGVFRKLDTLKKYNSFSRYDLLFKYTFNKCRTYNAIKERFLLNFMFDAATITRIPKYALNISYWKTFFEKIGNLLPFNIPKEDIEFTTKLKPRRYENFFGYISLNWISNRKLIYDNSACWLNLGILIDEKLINENIDITDKIIEKLITIDAINIPKLISKYGVDHNKLSNCNSVIFNEISKYFLKNKKYEFDNESI